MADRTNRRYINSEANGSLAYDYGRLAPEDDVYSNLAPQQQPLPAPQVEPESQPLREVEIIPRQSIAPFAILGYGLAAIVLVFALMAQIRLTTISHEIVQIESSIAALSEEQTKLLIAYESTINLAEIEAYAKDVLNMQKPHMDQVAYIGSTSSDKAVIISDGSTEKSFFDICRDILLAIGE